MSEKEQLYSEEAKQFNTMFLLGESEEEDSKEHPWNEHLDNKSIDNYQPMHILDRKTGIAFCDAVSDRDDQRLDVTELLGSNSLDMVGICDDCLDNFMENKD